MTNVPAAVWIDEDGCLVRLPEPAGVGDEWRAQDPASGTFPPEAAQRAVARRQRYLEGLRDWVMNGSGSVSTLDQERVLTGRKAPGKEDLHAGVLLELAHHHFEHGDHESARRLVAEAAVLRPEMWTFRRQSMVLEPHLVGQLNRSPEFWAAVAALGDRSYYEEVMMPD
jgi:hypothetical protein